MNCWPVERSENCCVTSPASDGAAPGGRKATTLLTKSLPIVHVCPAPAAASPRPDAHGPNAEAEAITATFRSNLLLVSPMAWAFSLSILSPRSFLFCLSGIAVILEPGYHHAQCIRRQPASTRLESRCLPSNCGERARPLPHLTPEMEY